MPDNKNNKPKLKPGEIVGCKLFVNGYGKQ